MAFVFTVETGSIVAGANSYVSVAEADDYYVIDSNFGAVWTAYTTEKKQSLLAWATRILDQKCSFSGYQSGDSQPLRWPRTRVRDRDGVAIAVDAIPTQLKAAVLELLKYILQNDPTTSAEVEHLRVVTVDVITLEYQEGTSQSKVPGIINQVLYGLGTYLSGNRGFGKISKSG
jgi:hypothetical protein